MKSSKAQIHTKFHKIPELRFEDQELTSFSGIIIFQLLFKRFDLKARMKKCFSHLELSPIFGHHLVVILLITHLILGFKRLRENTDSFSPEKKSKRHKREPFSWIFLNL